MIHYTCDYCHKAYTPGDVHTFGNGKDICKNCLTVRILDMAKALYLCPTCYIKMIDVDILLRMYTEMAEFFIAMNQSPKDILDKENGYVYRRSCIS